MARTTPKIAPSLWDFVTLPEEERATAIGNIHRKIGKDCTCGSGDILADRHTQRRAHHNTLPPLPWAKKKDASMPYQHVPSQKSTAYTITKEQHTTTILRPFVRDCMGEPLPEETLTHPPS